MKIYHNKEVEFDFEQLKELIQIWGDEKEITDPKNTDKQFMKFIEEVFEFKTEMDNYHFQIGISKNLFYKYMKLVINVLEKLNTVSGTKTSILYEYYHAKIKETYIEKNKNYGDSFGLSVSKYGLISALTRMSDKWNRLETLMTKEINGNDEPLIDTLLDLANYCLMTAVEIEKLNSKAPASK